jgi:proprotein convertase subtilisin/kexin type 5
MKEDFSACILSTSCVTSLYVASGNDFGNGYCENCPANCITCINSLICTECSGSYVVAIDYKSCILIDDTCGPGLYIDTAGKKICKSCPVNCNSCISASNQLKCTECTSSYYLVDDETLCTVACPIGQYQIGTTKVCDSCPTNCIVCSSNTICTECDDSYRLKSPGICDLKCAIN